MLVTFTYAATENNPTRIAKNIENKMIWFGFAEVYNSIVLID